VACHTEIVHDILHRYWSEPDSDSLDWHKVKFKIAPEKGDLTLPKTLAPDCSP
jgi:hypothetical protein